MSKYEAAGIPATIEDLKPLVTELSNDELEFVYGGMPQKGDGKGKCSWVKKGTKQCAEWEKDK